MHRKAGGRPSNCILCSALLLFDRIDVKHGMDTVPLHAGTFDTRKRAGISIFNAENQVCCVHSDPTISVFPTGSLVTTWRLVRAAETCPVILHAPSTSSPTIRQSAPRNHTG